MKSPFLIVTALLMSTFCASAQEYTMMDYVLDFGITEESGARLDRLYYEQKSYAEDVGLTVHSMVNHRYGEGFIEEDLSLSNLQTYYKAGLVWNILKNGWQQNRQSARRLTAQINYEQFEQAQNSKSNAYYAQFALLEYLFNKAGADVLRSRKEHIASKEPLFISLSNDGYLTSTQMLEYRSRADDIELQLRVLSESNDAFELIFEDELSTYLIPEFYQSTEIPEVDVQGIILAIDHSAAAQQQLHLQQQLIQKPSYWSHQVSLNATIYYNHQVSFSNERRDFTSVGVSLRVPLSTRHYSDKQAYIAANKELEEEQLLVTNNRKKEVLILHREYTLKQKQLNNLENEYQVLTARQRNDYLQRTAVNTEMPVTDVSLFEDEKMLVQLEQIEIQKQMYKILLKMNLLLAEHPITDFLSYIENDNFLTERE